MGFMLVLLRLNQKWAICRKKELRIIKTFEIVLKLIWSENKQTKNPRHTHTHKKNLGNNLSSENKESVLFSSKRSKGRNWWNKNGKEEFYEKC